jgi:hypothetical protein
MASKTMIAMKAQTKKLKAVRPSSRALGAVPQISCLRNLDLILTGRSTDIFHGHGYSNP